MTAALEWESIPAYVIGIARGVGATIGIAATFLFPILQSRLSTIRTGIWSIWFQVYLYSINNGSFCSCGGHFVRRDTDKMTPMGSKQCIFNFVVYLFFYAVDLSISMCSFHLGAKPPYIINYADGWSGRVTPRPVDVRLICHSTNAGKTGEEL